VSTVTAPARSVTFSGRAGRAVRATALRTYRFVALAARSSWKSTSTQRSEPSRSTTSGRAWLGRSRPSAPKMANACPFWNIPLGSGMPPLIGSALRANPIGSATVIGTCSASP